MKIVSWNVNGFRAVMKKDFIQSTETLGADILLLQETKLQEDQRTLDMLHLFDYESFWSYASTQKGYSGVVAYSSLTPDNVTTEFSKPEYDNEGRVIKLDFGDFVLFNVYFPNGQMNEERLQYKLDFYDWLLSYAQKLRDDNRSIIIAGDFNTAHNEIDLTHPKPNSDRSGFLRIERDLLDRMIDSGYVDTFRHFHPDTVKYSWWSYRAGARKKNVGWRIDYFFATRDLIDNNLITGAFIENDIYGSDHCPVGLTLSI